jgi:hypothetical protein
VANKNDNRNFLIELRRKRTIELQRLRHINSITGYAALSIDERLATVLREVRQTMSPAWIETLRTLTPAQKMARSNQMFVDARDALIRQEMGKGLSFEDARTEAVSRLLWSRVWPVSGARARPDDSQRSASRQDPQ